MDYDTLLLYHTSPEVRAAVHAVADIAIGARNRDDLFEKLIIFFSDYDKMRSEQVASLKQQLTDALMWSAKPMSIRRSEMIEVGTRVGVVQHGHGTVSNIRYDERGEAIYTVIMDEAGASLDGLFICRRQEILEI